MTLIGALFPPLSPSSSSRPMTKVRVCWKARRVQVGKGHSKISHKLKVEIGRQAAEYGMDATMAGWPILRGVWLT